VGVRTTELIRAIRTAKQFLTFVNAAPFQYAIAEGLTQSDDYLVEPRRRFDKSATFLRRDLMVLASTSSRLPEHFSLRRTLRHFRTRTSTRSAWSLPSGVVLWRSEFGLLRRQVAGRNLVRWMFQSVSKCSRKRSNAWSDFDDS